ncbi:MAG: DUF4215 domain-containing protein [Patescibacteria group bacterium]|nr:DUF4215 domain-containing protein [Patescibacteria group bacterium]
MRKKFLFLLVLFLVFSAIVPIYAQFGILVEVSPTSPTVGASATITVTGAGPSTGSPYAWVDISFGDGGSSNANDFTNPGGTFHFSFIHTYASEGARTITVEVCIEETIGAPRVCDTVTTLVTVSAAIPNVCGNGILEAPVEQCDDGNTDNGDGCDSNCQIESLTSSIATSYDNPLLDNNILEFLRRVIIFLFTSSIYLAVLMIIIGSYTMVTSGGVPTKIDKGKQIILWTLAAFAMIAVSRGIIELVWIFLGKK